MTNPRKIIYPQAFNSKYIRIHPGCEDDLRNLLANSGLEEDFWGKYRQRLRFLDDRREDCAAKRDWFEVLKNTGGLYAIKFNKSEKNIRIIFTFVKCRGLSFAVLLCAFAEKDRKRNSRYGYATWIKVAQLRLKEVCYDD